MHVSCIDHTLDDLHTLLMRLQSIELRDLASLPASIEQASKLINQAKDHARQLATVDMHERPANDKIDGSDRGDMMEMKFVTNMVKRIETLEQQNAYYKKQMQSQCLVKPSRQASRLTQTRAKLYVDQAGTISVLSKEADLLKRQLLLDRRQLNLTEGKKTNKQRALDLSDILNAELFEIDQAVNKPGKGKEDDFWKQSLRNVADKENNPEAGDGKFKTPLKQQKAARKSVMNGDKTQKGDKSRDSALLILNELDGKQKSIKSIPKVEEVKVCMKQRKDVGTSVLDYKEYANAAIQVNLINTPKKSILLSISTQTPSLTQDKRPSTEISAIFSRVNTVLDLPLAGTSSKVQLRHQNPSTFDEISDNLQDILMDHVHRVKLLNNKYENAKVLIQKYEKQLESNISLFKQMALQKQVTAAIGGVALTEYVPARVGQRHMVQDNDKSEMFYARVADEIPADEKSNRQKREQQSSLFNYVLIQAKMIEGYLEANNDNTFSQIGLSSDSKSARNKSEEKTSEKLRSKSLTSNKSQNKPAQPIAKTDKDYQSSTSRPDKPLIKPKLSTFEKTEYNIFFN